MLGHLEEEIKKQNFMAGGGINDQNMEDMKYFEINLCILCYHSYEEG